MTAADGKALRPTFNKQRTTNVQGSKHWAQAVAVTQPIPGRTSCATPEELLAYFARVSSAANQDNHLTGPKLIRRLIRDAEWSPLDMVSVTYEIRTSRAIARQILRHWSARFQEFSQRWSEADDLPYFTEARMKVPGNRAATAPAPENVVREWYARQQRRWDEAWLDYQSALAEGQHPESARVVLPEGMAPSRLYAQATVRTWLHYSQLRLKGQTQAEHRVVASHVWADLCDLFPTLKDLA